MRITFNDIKPAMGITETYDIVNRIRNSAGDNFKSYVPLANADNIAEVGAGILATQALQNEFISALVERIGLVVMRSVQLQNQLKIFKKGALPLGRTIEEIYVDITNEHQYDPEVAEQEVFKRVIPNVKTLFHERNRQGFYKQTIQDDSLRSAFVSWGNLEGFIAGIINAIYNSAEVDEYEYTKLLVDNYYSKGLFHTIKIDKPNTQTASSEFVKQARAVAKKMTLPNGSRDYNALAVRTRSVMDDLYLLIDADLEAEIDVDVLAKAFNMDRTNFLGHIIVIDGFASEGLEAVLVDRNWFMIYDTLMTMKTQYNAQGLYWNYYFHVWQTYSASRFANAVAFVTGDVKPVTSIIVDPTLAQIKPGRSMQLKAYVRKTVDTDYPIEWKVEAATGSVLDSATTISDDGLLTIGADQLGQVNVTASVNIAAEGEEPDLVSGESFITIV